MPSPHDQTGIDYEVLRQKLQSAQSDKQLFEDIVNIPFTFRVELALLFLGIIVLLLVDKESGTINRIALSNTELAKNTTKVSYVPFNEIKIPLTNPENLIAKAIATATPQGATDWKYLFVPALNEEQARINQASGGIAYSAVYPLASRGGGALIFSYFQYQSNIGKDQEDFMERYTALVDKSL
jgi:hypothetical protein